MIWGIPSYFTLPVRWLPATRMIWGIPSYFTLPVRWLLSLTRITYQRKLIGVHCATVGR